MKGVDIIVELHSVETQTEELSVHGSTEFIESVVDEDVVALSVASGIPVVTESGEAPPFPDDGRRAETQEEYEVIDDDDQSIEIDDHILVQKDVIVKDEIMVPDVEALVEEVMQETDVMCCLCEGTGMDYFGDSCTLCDGLGTPLEYDDESHRHVDESEAVDAIGDKRPERRVVSDGDWQKIRITLDSVSTVDVLPSDELCQMEAVPCTGSRANRTMFAANGTRIESRGEKKFKAVTDDGSRRDNG